jgi:hypothetical protein
MPSLGNKRIKTRKGPRIQINEPEAIEELLGLALARRHKNQRVIFFCSCPFPGTVHSPECHRVEVASLLLNAARRRNVQLDIVEWPGGSPKTIRYKLSDEAAESIRSGRRNLPLGTRRPSLELLGLPRASIIQFRSPSHLFRRLADPARFQGGQWLLPLPLEAIESGESLQQLKRRAEQDRHDLGFEVRKTRSHLGH